jgi:LPS export ABC transporter protein LptC
MALNRKTSLRLVIAGIALIIPFFYFISKMKGSSFEVDSLPDQATIIKNFEALQRDSSNDLIGTNGEKSTAEQSTFTLENFHRSETKNSRMLWEIYADKGVYMQSLNASKITNAKINYFRDDGSQIKMLGKDSIVYSEGTTISRAEVFNGVQVFYDEDYTLITEKAVYSVKNSTINSETPVEIRGKNMYATARFLQVDTNSKIINLRDSVKTIFKKDGSSTEVLRPNIVSESVFDNTMQTPDNKKKQ